MVLGIILLLCLIGLTESCKNRNTPFIDFFEKRWEYRKQRKEDQDRRWFRRDDKNDKDDQIDPIPDPDPYRRKYFFRRFWRGRDVPFSL